MDRRNYLRAATGVLGGAAGLGAVQASEPEATQATTGSVTQQDKLSAADGDTDDRFGQSIAVSSDASTVVVGAQYDEDPNGPNAGSTYVFERAGNSWLQQAKLTPDDGDNGDFFGRAVAVSSDGSTAIVGAPYGEDPNGTEVGAVYVFDRTGGSWAQQNKLIPDDGNGDDQFGSAVELSSDGSRALVGAPYDDDPNGLDAGSAYLFDRVGAAWNQQIKFAGADGNRSDSFGWSVGLSSDGSTAIVGARYDEDPNGSLAGSAYAFEETGGSWAQQGKFTPDDGDSNDLFGWSIAVSSDGSTAVVGALSDEDPNGAEAGSAYVFERTGGSWSQRAKLTASDGDTEDRFGWSVAVSSDGSMAIVGAYLDEDPNGTQAGSAYLFDGSGGSWTQQTKLSGPDGDRYDRFGSSVAASDDGSILVVGAGGDEDPNGDRAGSAYVFENEGTTGGLPTEDPTFQEVLAVIEAFNNGETYNGVNPGFQDVLTVIEAFNS